MEEIYILNEDGSIRGLQDRQEVHHHGVLHSAIQCWVMNSKGEVLIQRRAMTKDKSAGKWDVSFGGHRVKAINDENILVANVLKEGREELGLHINVNDLVKLGEVRYTSQENKNKELLGVFLIHVPDHQTFVFEDGEVSEVKWIRPADLHKNIIENPKEYANRSGAVALLAFYHP